MNFSFLFRTATLVCTTLCVVACPETLPEDDGGSQASVDSGTFDEDAGEAPVNDAGEAPVNDAGEAPVNDAGEAPVNDAGEAPVNDAGSSPVNDAGEAPVYDAGSSPVNDAGEASGPQDITNQIFTRDNPLCADYAGSYFSSVTDVDRNLSFEGAFDITTTSTRCEFSTNGIPNHDFNDAAGFPNDVGLVQQNFSTERTPSVNTSPTVLAMGFKSAILLNGVVIDVLPAACFGVGNEPLGQEKIGCGGNDYAWRYDPMFAGNSFGTDSHNAHSQPPSGKYHYHGNPRALFDEMDPAVASPVIGFAADGYPLFGSFIDDDGTVREVQSSYQLRAGTRSLDDLPDGLQEGVAPGGLYDGTFRDDYEFVEGLGDLDACNGRTVNGQYGYYITNAFPWVPNCFVGNVDTSFRRP